MVELNLGGVFDQQNALIVGNEFAEDIQGRGLSRSRAAADQDVLAMKNIVFQPIGERLVECPCSNQILRFRSGAC